jgi:hypothetical protein
MKKVMIPSIRCVSIGDPFAGFASLSGCLNGLAVLLISALLAMPTQAATFVFVDDFQDDTIGSTPAIGSGDIGTSWSDELAPGVAVASNPVLNGNTSSQVLKLNNKGAMDGNLSTGILLDGASLSTDFYIASDAVVNKITMKFRRADGTGPFNLNLKQDGSATGGLAVGDLMGISHYGADVWQKATWSFDYSGTSNFWDVALAFTNLETGATTSDIFSVALDVANSDLFTEVTPRGQGGGSVYVDNIAVSTVPLPAAAWLFISAIAGLAGAKRLSRSKGSA